MARHLVPARRLRRVLAEEFEVSARRRLPLLQYRDCWRRGAPPWALYAGCVLFGLGVGNLTTLPGVVLAREWPRERFGALVGLVVGINQFTFAFGPSLVGVLRDRAGSFEAALGACVALELIAAVLVLLGPGRVPATSS